MTRVREKKGEASYLLAVLRKGAAGRLLSASAAGGAIKRDIVDNCRGLIGKSLS